MIIDKCFLSIDSKQETSFYFLLLWLCVLFTYVLQAGFHPYNSVKICTCTTLQAYQRTSFTLPKLRVNIMSFKDINVLDPFLKCKSGTVLDLKVV